MNLSRAFARATVLGVLLASATPSALATPSATTQSAQSRAKSVRLKVQMSPHGLAWAELGQGRPLLLLNGTASPMSEWDPAFLAALSENARVIVFDYAGLGESKGRGQRSFEEMARSASQLLTDIGIPSADVLGWSMGGFIAQELMRSQPQQVERVVLMSTNPGGKKTVLGPPWVQRADSNHGSTLKTYIRTNYPKGACARSSGWRFINRLAAAQNSGRYPKSRVPSATNRAQVAAEDPWLRSNKNLRELRTVDIPTLLLVGKQDVITPPRNSHVLADAIPGAKLTLVPGAGHSVPFQAPDAVAEVVSGFMADGTAPKRLMTACA